MTRCPSSSPCRSAERSLPTAGRPRAARSRRGLTLVEMLVAMAITLVMMAAVVTVFANISGGVTRRRATIEMSSALANVREMLRRDLHNATCPTIPPRSPESNQGYLEIIEGPQSDSYPSVWLYDGPDADTDTDGLLRLSPAGETPGIDLAVSSLPGSNLLAPGQNPDTLGRGRLIGSGAVPADRVPTDGRALGDADDVLMLTVRNEGEPFVGRIPQTAAGAGSPGFPTAFAGWGTEEFESPLAEVVWWAVENPPERDDARTFAFGEPGYRTIYRRALLVAPSLEYRIPISGTSPTQYSGPGVVRVLPDAIDADRPASAVAALIAFQERYDLSVRVEWDPLLGADGRWVLRANTLADLTKRENRFEHHGLWPKGANLNNVVRQFPFAAASSGSYAGLGLQQVTFVPDPELSAPTPAGFRAVPAGDGVAAFEPAAGATRADLLGSARRYAARPLALLLTQPTGAGPATARAIVNEDNQVVAVTKGLAPLGGARRGDDVVMTDALSFDLRVYDPGAPLYGYYQGGVTTQRADTLVAPGDPPWAIAYRGDSGNGGVGEPVGQRNPVVSASYPFAFDRQGAYVDLGYRATFLDLSATPPGSTLVGQFLPAFLPVWSVASNADPQPVTPRFLEPRPITLPGGQIVAPGYAVFDTWSDHYESNGLDEDGDGLVDEAANGIDDLGVYRDPAGAVQTARLYGPDDPGERETTPPYEAALRGVQVTLRAYERDSRQVRQTEVRESFIPE